MKGGHILAAVIALLVALFAMVIIAAVIMIPAVGMSPNVRDPIMIGVRLLIFGIVFIVVFREMSEKFIRGED